MNDNGPLNRLRNSPNLAGTLLAILMFVSVMLIAPMFKKAGEEIDWQTTIAIASAIAFLGFFKGRRAVQRRLWDD